MKKLIITGYVGRNPEVKQNKDGSGEFATFSVGVHIGTTESPKTDWVEVSCNDKLVNIAKLYCNQGAKVLIEGFPSVSSYINSENQTVVILKLFAHVIEVQ